LQIQRLDGYNRRRIALIIKDGLQASQAAVSVHASGQP
jgi:hypothetical protein